MATDRAAAGRVRPGSRPAGPAGESTLQPQEPPVDSDVDLRDRTERAELPSGTLALLATIAAGGMLGALARHALAVVWPNAPGDFGWATFVTNVSGCLLIGVLMVLITEVRTTHRLLRPFLGVGVLGGYTTFSTYAVQAQQAIAVGRPGTALAYLAGTLVAALAAVWCGLTVTRRLTAGASADRPARPG